MDSNCTSHSLAKYLLTHKTYMCGTVRKNLKPFPHEVMKAKLKKGEIMALENNGIKVFNWKDKQNVITVSTIPEHDANLVEVRDKNIKKEA